MHDGSDRPFFIKVQDTELEIGRHQNYSDRENCLENFVGVVALPVPLYALKENWVLLLDLFDMLDGRIDGHLEVTLSELHHLDTLHRWYRRSLRHLLRYMGP